VRLYRVGDQGEPVRDIQDRLLALGVPSEPDRPGDFGPGTTAAVVTFQASRNLATDGIVGPDTWRALVGAGHRLGSRLLYHRVPMMRGDDVADLQHRLSALGFDAGKVDGIFGPDTLAAVLEFQANRRMAEDGMAGSEVATELALMTGGADKLGLSQRGREEVRERQWLASLPTHVVGQRVYVDAFCRSETERDATWNAAVIFSRIIQDLGAWPVYSRSADTAPPERVRALRANRAGVDLIVSFATVGSEAPGVLYFASSLSHSEAGAHLADAVAEQLDLEARGRAIPMLKDTRSPAIVVVDDPMDGPVGGAVAQGLIDLFARSQEVPAAERR
jgi:N-acetylmuramoyl-L-alanine amidase